MSNTQELYKEINTLEKSILPNEAKANDLRKLFEKLLHSILGTDPAVKHINLGELIDMVAIQENRHDLQYICHRLRKDLNPWSHHNSEKLDDFDLEDYFARFRNLVRVIKGEEDSTSDNPNL